MMTMIQVVTIISSSSFLCALTLYTLFKNNPTVHRAFSKPKTVILFFLLIVMCYIGFFIVASIKNLPIVFPFLSGVILFFTPLIAKIVLSIKRFFTVSHTLLENILNKTLPVIFLICLGFRLLIPRQSFDHTARCPWGDIALYLIVLLELKDLIVEVWWKKE